MTTFREKAQAYEPKLTRNIAELPQVPIDAQIFENTGINKKGEEFTYSYMVFNTEEYRVPDSVLKALKAILETKPQTEFVRVTKTGEGLNSSYTVIQL